MKVKALRDKVLVVDLERGERKVGSFYLPDDNGKSSGVRPRWARVYSIGKDIKDIKVGQWILIAHGRWTRTVKIKNGDTEVQLWGVDWPDSVMCVCDEDPESSTFSNFL